MTQIEIDIEDLAKAKKRIWVKPTATRKGYYREQEVGRKEGEKLGVEERVMSKEKQRKKWGSDIKSLVIERDGIKKDLSAAQDISESYLKEMHTQVNMGENISKTRLKYAESQKVWHGHNDKINVVDGKIARLYNEIDKSYD